jgi:hypothetical protein
MVSQRARADRDTGASRQRPRELRLEKALRCLQHRMQPRALVLLLDLAWAGRRDGQAGLLRQPLDRLGEAQALGEHHELEDVAVLARREIEPGALVVVDEKRGRALLLEGGEAFHFAARAFQRYLARHHLADGQPARISSSRRREAHGFRITRISPPQSDLQPSLTAQRSVFAYLSKGAGGETAVILPAVVVEPARGVAGLSPTQDCASGENGRRYFSSSFTRPLALPKSIWPA